MEFLQVNVFSLSLLLFAVAFLYSSVGHGGASGYLAILSFFMISPGIMSATALILNIIVSSAAFFNFYRAKQFSLKFTLPFIVASIPAAFLGGTLTVPENTYVYLLTCVLLFAAYRLIFINGKFSRSIIDAKTYGNKTGIMLISLFAGALTGFVSGVVGIGGGIFLSPLIIFLAWTTPKQAAATSSFFILVNSISGLFARFLTGGNPLNNITGITVFFMLFTLAGGFIGSHLGANHFSSLKLRRILGIVLIIASVKLFFSL